MATRNRIAIENQDGTVISIYCHWDGHIETNGKILFENYDMIIIDESSTFKSATTVRWKALSKMLS